MKWIPVAEDTPWSGERVIFSWVNSFGHRRTSMGYYSGKLALLVDDWWDNFSNLNWDDDYFEFHPDDPDHENPYLPVGWWEEGAEGEYCYSQSGVTHWMKLPDLPEEKI